MAADEWLRKVTAELKRGPKMVLEDGAPGQTAKTIIEKLRQHRYSWEHCDIPTLPVQASDWLSLSDFSNATIAGKTLITIDSSGWIAYTDSTGGSASQLKMLVNPSCTTEEPAARAPPFDTVLTVKFPAHDAFAFDPANDVAVLLGKPNGDEERSVTYYFVHQSWTANQLVEHCTWYP